ncbi:hypothetical protein HMPREF9136_1892 [Prevotella dentalis DSM 3688]|uniref:Uncharacterized protein n=1 Tax=Prevotella dentalis (strain ATCC 49559 / DSM 3688 / JCM 13448 / NCTC 12043 / ES 2772) TaxID=908937 RepID=F9D4W4_PREDD|nr:hypothetical protein HMPREF9136_1892 [Prevotella dentalis DSM 3688]
MLNQANRHLLTKKTFRNPCRFTRNRYICNKNISYFNEKIKI